MKIKILLTLTIAFFLSACKDKDDAKGYGPTSVKGKVLTYGTTNGVPNANLWLYEVDNSGFNPSYSIIAQTTTNLSGEYSFNFNARKDRSYEIEAKAYRHFENSQTQNKGVLALGGENHIDIPLYGYALGKFRLRNLSMAVEFDMETMLDLDGNYNSNIFQGVKVDTTIYRVLKGTKVNKVMYYIIKDSMTVGSIEKEFKTNDTTYVEIDY